MPVVVTPSGITVRFWDTYCVADVLLLRRSLHHAKASVVRIAEGRDFVLPPVAEAVSVEDVAAAVALLHECGARSVYVRPDVFRRRPVRTASTARAAA